MASPQKPWERIGVNSQSMDSSLSNSMSSLPQEQTRVPGLPAATPGVGSASSNNPPQVPTRPSQQSAYNSFNGLGYSSGYSSRYGLGYGSNMYNSPYSSGLYGSGMYGGGLYGTGGYGMMERYGMNMNQQPDGFVRAAEDSTRQAFQSIESIVQAFGSVAMMLESTYSAVFNSFRAVLGVADQFGRMRTHFTQIFSAFALFRTLRWLYHKFLVLCRLRPADSPDDVWKDVVKSAAAGAKDAASSSSSSSSSSWPILFFFAVIVSGPWLIWKFLSSLSPIVDKKGWMTGEADHYLGQAEFDFQGESNDELTFTRGQHIYIAPKELQPQMRGWLLASVDGNKSGIIPANYIKVLGKRSGRRPSSAATPGRVPIHASGAVNPTAVHTLPSAAAAQPQGLPATTTTTPAGSSSFGSIAGAFSSQADLPSLTSIDDSDGSACPGAVPAPPATAGTPSDAPPPPAEQPVHGDHQASTPVHSPDANKQAET